MEMRACDARAVVLKARVAARGAAERKVEVNILGVRSCGEVGGDSGCVDVGWRRLVA